MRRLLSSQARPGNCQRLVNLVRYRLTTWHATLRSRGMARALPTELDLTQLYQQFCAELTQVQTLMAGVDSCAALIESCFAPRSYSIVWDTGRGPHVLTPYPGALAPP